MAMLDTETDDGESAEVGEDTVSSLSPAPVVNEFANMSGPQALEMILRLLDESIQTSKNRCLQRETRVKELVRSTNDLFT